MGMFDSVYVDCPECGKKVEFQSKVGECALDVFTIENAPTMILRDILNDPNCCRSCGHWFALMDPRFPIKPVRPAPKCVSVRPPEKPEVSGSYKFWPWDRPFTADDVLAEVPERAVMEPAKMPAECADGCPPQQVCDYCAPSGPDADRPISDEGRRHLETLVRASQQAHTLDRIRAWPANIEGDQKRDLLDASTVRTLLDEAATHIEALHAGNKDLQLHFDVLMSDYKALQSKLTAAHRILERCRTVLGNMALEREGAIFNRWPISHEPLRADAKNLVPLIDKVLDHAVPVTDGGGQ